MKKKNLLILGMGAVMCLTACGHTPTIVDQELPNDDPSSLKEIVFWTCLGHLKTENLQKIADSFNAEHIGKYHVSLVHLAGDYDSLHDALKTKLASGEIPALAMGYPDSFSEYITNDIEYSSILRLNNFINDPDFGYSSTELADFVPGYYAEGTGYQFEGTWSMPMYKSTEVMYYNKSYFYGVNPQNYNKFKNDKTFETLYGRVNKTNHDNSDTFDEDLDALKEYVDAHDGYTYEVPTKWDQWFDLGKQMIADRKTENVTNDEFYPIGYDSDANMLISQMKQRNIPYTVNNEETEADPNKHFQFNNQQAKQLVSKIVGYLEDKVLITKGSLGGSTYTNTYFNEGKIAMTVGSTGGSSYNISSNFEVALAPVPYYGDEPQYIQQGPSICFFDNIDPYIHKGAWLFYKEIANTENNTKLALENSYDPVRASCYDTEDYKTWIAQAGRGLAWDIPAITSTLTQYYMTSPVFVGSSEARRQMGELLADIYLKKMSVDDAFKYAFNKCKAAA